MTASHRGARAYDDRLSPESYYALLAALTVIKAQSQMVERWVHRVPVTDPDVPLRRLRSIERAVEELVAVLDAMPAPPGSDAAAPSNGTDPA